MEGGDLVLVGEGRTPGYSRGAFHPHRPGFFLPGHLHCSWSSPPPPGAPPPPPLCIPTHCVVRVINSVNYICFIISFHELSNVGLGNCNSMCSSLFSVLLPPLLLSVIIMSIYNFRDAVISPELPFCSVVYYA